MSQIQQIKAHLESGQTITPLQALRRFGCMRLSGRILELRDEPYYMNISTTMIKVGSRKKVAEYKLER